MTATATPYIIYLPFTEKAKPLDPDAYRTSLVLVLDRSTSMLRPIEAGGIPKNEAAIEAAKTFVGLLQLKPNSQGKHDQVAVAGFNDEAWIEQELDSDRAAALASLDRIRGKTQEGTVLVEAEKVKGAGTKVFTVGLGEGEDVLRPLLEAVSTTPGDYLFAPDGEDLAAIYRQVGGRIMACP